MSAPVQIGTEMGPKFKSNLFGQQPSPHKPLMGEDYLTLLIGVPEGNRTPDPRFRKPVLYPAELPGRLNPPAASDRRALPSCLAESGDRAGRRR